jgi:hypothetical protein
MAQLGVQLGQPAVAVASSVTISADLVLKTDG